MPIIIDPNKQLINITYYYTEKTRPHGNSLYYFINSADELQRFKDIGFVLEKEAPKNAEGKTTIEPDKIIYVLETTWRTPTWRDQNLIFTKSVKHMYKPDGTSINEIDAIAYRDWKLKTCLKKWTVMGEDNKPLEVTETLIDNLNPVIAQELLSGFERVTEPTETDYV